MARRQSDHPLSIVSARRTLDFLTQSANLLRSLRLLPVFHTFHFLEEQVRRLRRIHGLIDMVILGSLLEDADAIEVAPLSVVGEFQGTGYILVGVVVKVGFGDGRGESGLASHQVVLAELLLFDLSDDPRPTLVEGAARRGCPNTTRRPALRS